MYCWPVLVTLAAVVRGDWAIKANGGLIQKTLSDTLGNILVGIDTNAQTTQLFGPNDEIVFASTRLTTNPTNHTGVLLAKLFSNGDVQWVVQMESDANDTIQSISCDGSGNIYVAGLYDADNFSIYNRIQNNVDIALPKDNYPSNGFVAKFSPNGSLIWAMPVQGVLIGVSVQIFRDSVIIATQHHAPFVSGSTYPRSTAIYPINGEIISFSGKQGVTLIRLSSNGSLIWINRFWNVFRGVVAVNSKGMITVGSSCGVTASCQILRGNAAVSSLTFPTGAGALVTTFNIDGNVTWSNYLETTGISRTVSTQIMENGDVYWAGWYQDGTTKLYDSSSQPWPLTGITQSFYFFLVKSNSSGHIQWTKKWMSPWESYSGRIFMAAQRIDDIFFVITMLTRNSTSVKNDSDVNELTIGATNTWDSVLINFSSEGKILWSSMIHQTLSSDYVSSLEMNPMGTLYYTGYSTADTITLTGQYQNVMIQPRRDSYVWGLETGSSFRQIISGKNPNSSYCWTDVRNASISLLQYEKEEKLFSVRLQQQALLKIVSSDNFIFYSLEQEELYRMNTRNVADFSILIDSAVSSPVICGALAFQRGPNNKRGSLLNGTLSFDITPQHGIVNEFALDGVLSRNSLIRFRLINFSKVQFGFRNASHVFHFLATENTIDVKFRVITNSESLLGNVVTSASFALPVIPEKSVFAMTLIQNQTAFYVNGLSIFNFTIYNASSFLFTTDFEYGSVDLMGIMTLPLNWTSWLTYFEDATTSVSDIDMATSTTETVINTLDQTAAETTTLNGDDPGKKPPSIFGLSGILLYIVFAAIGFVVMLINILLAIWIIRFRRNKFAEQTRTYMDTTTKASIQTTQMGTLVNNNASSFTFHR